MMREEEANVNGLERDQHEENTAESGERRPSIVTLQNMLKTVSQSPLHNHYNPSFMVEDDYFHPDLAQSGHQERLHLSPRNGLSENVVKSNPFYSYYLESTSKSSDMEDVGRKASEEANLAAIFAPPPTFQSSHMDLEPEIKPVENGDKFSQPDIFQTHKHEEEDLLLSSILGQKTSPNGDFQDLTFKMPNFFNTNSPHAQHASKLREVKSAEVLKDKEEDLFQALKGEDLLRSERSQEINWFNESSHFVDPFKSASDKDDLFRSPQTVPINPFYTTPGSESDLFRTSLTKHEELFSKRRQDVLIKDEEVPGTSSKGDLDIFLSSSTNPGNPFQSPLTPNIFQDFSSLEDPFSPTPSKSHDLLQDVSDGTPDIFQSHPPESKARMDLFVSTPSNTAFSTPSISPSEMKLDFQASPDLLPKKMKSPPAVPPKPLHKAQEIILTTPQGSKHNILRPTPFSQASSLSPSPNQSPSDMDHVQVFKRPPRPLPRTRPPRPAKPPKPAIPVEKESDVPKDAPNTTPKPALRPLPKPVIRRKPKTPEPKPVEPENYVVFEDILLTGQERCVDDWPEDSPEHNPDFKPAGKFRLRRESLLLKTDSDGGSSEEQGGSRNKSKKKFRMSLLPRKNSKKFPEDMVEGKSNTLPASHKSSKESLTDVHASAGEYDDEEQNGMKYRKPQKAKVNQVFRRASTASCVNEQPRSNGPLSQELKKGGLDKKSHRKSNTIERRWSEGNMLDEDTGGEEEGGEARREKTKKRVKIKFVPQRGFAITLEKQNDEPKGAHGYTPRKASKDNSPDEVLGAHGYTPNDKSKAAFMDDEHLDHYFQKEDEYEFQDSKVKKPTKTKVQHAGRRSSNEKMLESSNMLKKKSSFSAEELKDKEVEGSEEDEMTGKNLKNPAALYDEEEDDIEILKSKKTSKLKRLKIKDKSKTKCLDEGPQGAASNRHLSEAAKAEWRAAQMDERAIADQEDEEDEGDTDSLMEWWYTVEKWDEVPSDEEGACVEKDGSKSFTILANKVHHGLRLFNKVFTEKAETLWQSILLLHGIADDISEFHHKAKIAGITGGTTTAVGSVAAITGLALAPFTLGASLVITAVGVGVAAAGGITSASAAISDNVHNNHDRKKVEHVLKEYEDHLLDIAKILHFVNKGLSKLRGHPFLRSGTQHYSEDWEIRRAVQMISLVDMPVMRATELIDTAVTSLQGLFKGMDKYFMKDTRELKKGCKKEIVAEIREVANVLNDSIVEINTIRESLQEATGNI